jgi:hypothetical protein
VVSGDGRTSKVVVPLSTIIPCDVVNVEKVVVIKPTSLKIGDRFKDKQTGKIYILKWMLNKYTALLEGENGMGRRITDEENLRRTCEKLEDKES